MSRVRKPGKFVNENHYDSSVYGPSKMVRIHCENEDYHKSSTLSQWLFVKYDMSYKTYARKSKNRKDELRAEFEADTGAESPLNTAIASLKFFSRTSAVIITSSATPSLPLF